MARPKKKTEDEIIAETKATVLKKVEDVVHDLLYNDRKEDKELSSEKLFDLLDDKSIVSTADIINAFARELRKEVE